MMKSIYALLLLTMLTTACSKKQSDSSSSSGTKVDSPTISIIDPNMPFLTSEDVNKLYEQAEKVDLIFYNHPISVNQEDAASVKNTVRYVLPTPPSVTSKCPALGRLAWLADGVIIKEADVFVGNGCNYLLFIEKNQPVAANALASEGVDFFNTIISQVNQQIKKQ